jgi:UDP-N-acetyl-D-mannosaminuronic acid dehydrogenase
MKSDSALRSTTLPLAHRADAPTQTVCIVGLGYIGLPTAAVLADAGHRVFGVDVRPDVVELINQGKIHIHEPHLDSLVAHVVRQGALHARLQPCEADVFILCVPTPHHEDKAPDVTYVAQAAKSIAPYVRRGNLVILESTSPPGTTENTVIPRSLPAGFTVGEDIFYAHCPERVLPGRILIEVVENDRVVGGVTPACTARTKAFYETFVRGQVWTTSAITAEIVKLTENAFRDVNIAFANELSLVADDLGADVFEIIQLANKHPRVNILNPGPGVGGHCISVDPWFLIHASPKTTPLMLAARRVNDGKPGFVVEKIIQAAASVPNPVIGCLGLAYKADVDDLRESPSIQIVREIQGRGLGEVLVCDPFVAPERFTEFPLVSLEEVLERAQILVLLTAHTEFRNISPERLKDKQVIDVGGVWRALVQDRGAQGRPHALPLHSNRAA